MQNARCPGKSLCLSAIALISKIAPIGTEFRCSWMQNVMDKRSNLIICDAIRVPRIVSHNYLECRKHFTQRARHFPQRKERGLFIRTQFYLLCDT